MIRLCVGNVLMDAQTALMENAINVKVIFMDFGTSTYALWQSPFLQRTSYQIALWAMRS